MTIIRVGTTKKYSEGWESAFAKGKKKATPDPVATKSAKKATTKKAPAKKAPAKAVAAKSTKKKSSVKKSKKK